MKSNALFWGSDLSVHLEKAEARARYLTRELSDQALRERDDADLVAEIVSKVEVKAPKLLLDQAHQLPIEDVRLEIIDFGERLDVPGTRVTVVIPFEGDRNLFFARPSSFTSVLPRGTVQDSDVRLSYAWRQGATFDLAGTHARELEGLQRYLAWVTSDVEKGNARLPSIVMSELSQKRGRLAAAEAAASGLGLPVRKSDGPTPAHLSTARPASRAKEFDAFICHASEDKGLVDPLARALRSRGCEIWYDDFVLKVGDSLRRSIDSGLSRSRFGVVVLSEAFFAKQWPQYELDGLVAKEIEGRKVILPIWHQVSIDRIRSYSPTLADRVALAMPPRSIDEVVAALLAEFSR